MMNAHAGTSVVCRSCLPPLSARPSLARLLEGDWLAPGAIVVFERGSDEPEIDTPGYERLDARDYGAARVLFLRASEASA